jgi:hypothetical protein
VRLPGETHLCFKRVQRIQAIQLVKDVKSIQKGEGGYAEDNEYFGELASI